MIIQADCLNAMKDMNAQSVDLVYVDPPFFSQKNHRLLSREDQTYKFDDTWRDIEEYKAFILVRVLECHRLLKTTGSIFLHCDRAASHHLRIILDEVFGSNNFQSEIIWAYRRWSNSKKGLLNGHQTIYFYSKTDDFKFNSEYTDYSPTTNLDQILQKRERDAKGKAVYMRSADGVIQFGGAKKGVPLTDVWDIPFLNPKATERTGYPTQKPIHLLERIIKLASDQGDVILDPFCGSGTTVVASYLLNRAYIGIDRSEDAVSLTRRRLAEPIKSESRLLQKGKEAYLNQSPEILRILELIDAVAVQRNGGIDGFLKQEYEGKSVPVRVQRDWETIQDAKITFRKACIEKGCKKRILILTNNLESQGLWVEDAPETDLVVIDALHLTIGNALRNTG